MLVQPDDDNSSTVIFTESNQVGDSYAINESLGIVDHAINLVNRLYENDSALLFSLNIPFSLWVITVAFLAWNIGNTDKEFWKELTTDEFGEVMEITLHLGSTPERMMTTLNAKDFQDNIAQKLPNLNNNNNNNNNNNHDEELEEFCNSLVISSGIISLIYNGCIPFGKEDLKSIVPYDNELAFLSAQTFPAVLHRYYCQHQNRFCPRKIVEQLREKDKTIRKFTQPQSRGCVTS